MLDLGSGTGKICFIASQVVGPTGKVIGVDMTDDMLEVARRNAPIVAATIGHANVEFRKGRIQDLARDLEIPLHLQNDAYLWSGSDILTRPRGSKPLRRALGKAMSRTCSAGGA